MYFTEEELKLVVGWARWRTLRSLGIVEDDDLYAPADALDMLAAVKGHRDALDEFAAAYVAWYQFHLEIYKAGKSGNLSTSESAVLDGLIERRERARHTLIKITA
ncbi:hypothetical protein DBR17_13485 [Sphingomonas sp. HMWF008]|nr:hypothetical protein DBR17_13485 [Sphingomonas sp. HMWF008]